MTWTQIATSYNAHLYPYERAASEMITTKTVEMIDGWYGQAIMNGKIVYETGPQKDSKAAQVAVDNRLRKCFEWLLENASVEE